MSLVAFIKEVGQPTGPVEIVAYNHLIMNRERVRLEGVANIEARYTKAGVKLLFLPQDICPGTMLFEIINHGSYSTLLQPRPQLHAGQN